MKMEAQQAFVPKDGDEGEAVKIPEHNQLPPHQQFKGKESPENTRNILVEVISPEQVLLSLSKLVIPKVPLTVPSKDSKPSREGRGSSGSDSVRLVRPSESRVKKAQPQRIPQVASSESTEQSTSRVRNLRPRKVVSSKEREQEDKGQRKEISGRMNFSSNRQVTVVGGDQDEENMEMDEDSPYLPNGNGQVNTGVNGAVFAASNGNGIAENVASTSGIMGFGLGQEDSIEAFVSPPAPPTVCGNGFGECKLVVIPASAAFPCGRCHREFYCSEAHRANRLEGHKSNCKTPSSLEVIFSDEQYSKWYKYAAHNLYDICLNFVLVWPSLTAQWLPQMIELDNNTMRHQLLIGTQTTGETNHLIICGIDVPGKVDSETDINEPHARHTGSLYVMKRINHENEIHRARYMPQNSNIVATKSPSPDVFLFDCSTFPEIPEDGVFKPTLRLRGHTKEGFGLAWNPNISGRLLSGSTDGIVCLWDINAKTEVDCGDHFMNAMIKLEKHTSVVEGVAWHHESNNICASVGDDRKMILWDIRLDGRKNCIHMNENAHEGDINSVAFSCFSDYTLATGSSDRSIALWDMRNLKYKLHKLEHHKDDVMQVEWSPHNSMTLASTGKDRRVFLWNISLINSGGEVSVQPNEEDISYEGPPELQFIHGGHVCAVNDIAWNLHEVGMLASVSEDNILQVWKIDDHLRASDGLSEEEWPDQQMSSQSGAEDI